MIKLAHDSKLSKAFIYLSQLHGLLHITITAPCIYTLYLIKVHVFL